MVVPLGWSMYLQEGSAPVVGRSRVRSGRGIQKSFGRGGGGVTPVQLDPGSSWVTPQLGRSRDWTQDG